MSQSLKPRPLACLMLRPLRPTSVQHQAHTGHNRCCPLSFYLSLSLFLSMPLSISLSLYFSLSLFLSISVSLSLFLSFSVSLSFCLLISVFLSFSLSFCLSLLSFCRGKITFFSFLFYISSNMVAGLTSSALESSAVVRFV